MHHESMHNARMRSRTHAYTHAQTHMCMHARKHTSTYAHMRALAPSPVARFQLFFLARAAHVRCPSHAGQNEMPEVQEQAIRSLADIAAIPSLSCACP